MKPWPYSTWMALGAGLMGLAVILSIPLDSAVVLLGLGGLGLACGAVGLAGLVRAARGDQAD